MISGIIRYCEMLVKVTADPSRWLVSIAKVESVNADTIFFMRLELWLV